jgi:hypothetical protein
MDKIDRQSQWRNHVFMTAVEIEGCWCDTVNWKLGCVYFCRQDPRLIVPKRIKGLGWTLNFARPLALPCLALMIVLLLAPIVLMLALGIERKFWYVAACCVEMVILCCICSRLASSRRYADKR